jgi:uncharacterized protein YodC (DUF2158 family)
MEFKVGDVVMLKSGGSPMTVEQVGKRSMTNEDLVWCVWFEDAGKRQVVKRETFPPGALMKAAD